MKYNAVSMRNLDDWRNKLFVKTTRGKGDGGKAKCWRGEKGEKGEKEIENEILNVESKNPEKDGKNLNIYLDVDKVINSLSGHLEKIQNVDRKEKMVDKKKGDIIYKTKDGRVLRAFHSCERGKIIWEDNVYDDLKTWLAAASLVAPSRCYD